MRHAQRAVARPVGEQLKSAGRALLDRRAWEANARRLKACAELLKARLEPDMLQDVGHVKDRQDFHKKQVRMNTQQLYTQQKYNLFREESECAPRPLTLTLPTPASPAARPELRALFKARLS